MTHALGSNFGRHARLHHSAHPGGWWKFGLVALAAAGIGIALVHSPLLQESSRTPDAAPLPALISLAPEAVHPTVLLPEQPHEAATADAIGTEPARPAVASAASLPAPPPNTNVPAQQGGSIRDIDFAALPVIQALVRQLAGRVDRAQIKYADVTADGDEDAVVPITSDGTYGNLAYVVFALKAGTPEAILTRIAGRERRGLILTYDRGQLAETSGIYGPTDANCCPSQIIKTYYRWNDQALVFDRTETITIPRGPKAD